MASRSPKRVSFRESKRLDVGQAFLNRQDIDGVSFAHNNYVRVVTGELAGCFGSLVSLIAIEPEPLFILESEAGFDVRVRQSDIEFVADS
jgi:hypothetical protein